LTELNSLPRNIPLILEHLPQEEYPLAQKYVLEQAHSCGLHFYQPTGESDEGEKE
jgi:hypothetical protein